MALVFREYDIDNWWRIMSTDWMKEVQEYVYVMQEKLEYFQWVADVLYVFNMW